MKIKKILLTSDDGYKSSGIRLLIAALKDKYDLTIAATVSQQSAVGGKISIENGFDWGIDEVDGIKAFWVKGTPADAMTLLSRYHNFNSKFDLIISGVNWGCNLGTSLFTSGTVNAALIGIGCELANHGIAISWDLPSKYYLDHHDGNENLADFSKYPGEVVDQLLDLAIKNKLWGSRFLNINLPHKPSKDILFTKTVPDVKKIYPGEQKLNIELGKMKKGHFSYIKYSSTRSHKFVENLSYDVAAINKGYISITPCSVSLLDEKAFVKIKEKKIKL